MEKINVQNLIKQICFGFTAASVIATYCISLCAVLNQGIVVALILVVFFAIASFRKDTIYAPSPLLAVVFFFLLQFNSFAATVISLASGCFICFILNKSTKGKPVPDFISGGVLIGLALCSTILFTNAYFGIGASGYTTLDMLKSYRSLGFHPDFRGLLYGTITLFTMITYPFKFRKLKNIIPPEFITILIPFVLNLILNPDPSYTTTNEYSAVEISNQLFNLPDFSAVGEILSSGFSAGFILHILSQSTTEKTGNILTVHPVISCNTIRYGVLPFAVTLVCSTVIILLAPSLIYRLPLPCAGAMLIVSAWQHTSFKPLSATIKKKSVVRFLLLILCGVGFVILTPDYAVALCIMLWIIIELINRRRRAKA